MARKREIKTIRRSLGETQEEFGRRFGVDQATICRWEVKGEPPRGPAKIMLEDLRRSVKAQAAE